MIKLTFTGAAGEVTGSRHLIETDNQKILLDCGLYQGRRKDTYERNLNFPFDPASINSLILSHSHIDHIGNVPNLVKKGFQGDIHCTLATADLANIMLMDTAHILESDAAYVTKIRNKHHEPPVEPLFNRQDVLSAIQLIEGHGYNRQFKLNGVQAIFREAGHIMGSALTIIDFVENGKKLSLCYTGDFGHPNRQIIKDPYIVTEADILIIESTYGNRLHNDVDQLINNKSGRLVKVLNETIGRGEK